MTAKRKRFYETADVAKRMDDTYGIRLDGAYINTPEGNPLVAHTRELAEAVAQEWLDQEDELDPTAMPMTQLLNTAIDRVAPAPLQVVDAVKEFARAELVCYRSDDDPDLAELQATVWDPLLKWLEREHGIVMKTSAGIAHVEQPEENFEKLRGFLTTLSIEQLTALQSAVGTTGSLVIPIALIDGRIDAQTALEAAELDSLYQADKWGKDAAVMERYEALKSELFTAKRFADLSQL